MTKTEWEVLRSMDRRTRFIAQRITELEKQGADVAALKEVIEDWKPDIEEMRNLIKLRRQIHRVVAWVLAVALAAGITTYVNKKTELFIQYDQRQSAPQREEGKNVNLE